MQRVKSKSRWLVEGTFLSWEAQEMESKCDAHTYLILRLFQTTSQMPITKVCDEYENMGGAFTLSSFPLTGDSVDGMFFANSPRLLVPVLISFLYRMTRCLFLVLGD